MVKICQYHSECNREAATKIDLYLHGRPEENVSVCRTHKNEAEARGIRTDE